MKTIRNLALAAFICSASAAQAEVDLRITSDNGRSILSSDTYSKMSLCKNIATYRVNHFFQEVQKGHACCIDEKKGVQLTLDLSDPTSTWKKGAPDKRFCPH
jgi:hypothetical protein